MQEHSEGNELQSRFPLSIKLESAVGFSCGCVCKGLVADAFTRVYLVDVSKCSLDVVDKVHVRV